MPIALDGGQDLLPCGLPLQPQIVVVDAAAAGLVVPQAEGAGVITAVGGVDVEVPLVLIGDGKALFHIRRSSKNFRTDENPTG